MLQSEGYGRGQAKPTDVGVGERAVTRVNVCDSYGII